MESLPSPSSLVCVLLLTTVNLSQALFSGRNQRNNFSIWPTSCGHHTITQPKGYIASPVKDAGHQSYVNNTSCMWHLKFSKGTVTTLSFAYVDIEETSSCAEPPCCTQNWLSVKVFPESSSSYTNHRLCGQTTPPPVITTGKGVVVVKFYANLALKGGKGFRLDYISQNQSELAENVCKSDEFMCSSGKCILQSWRCNGWDECGDKSDEENCLACPKGSVSCTTGSSELTECYDPALQRCDGTWDCALGRDEMGCATCKHDELICKDGSRCFKLAQMCDGHYDCLDKTDELDSRCGLDMSIEEVVSNKEPEVMRQELCLGNLTSCGLSGECFDPLRQRCDGKPDCSSGEDERNCTHSCNGRLSCLHVPGCYFPWQHCNGIAECVDESDEEHCEESQCRPETGGFLCRNSRCVSRSLRCDRINDCGDESDEQGCLKNSVITAAVLGSLICSLLLVIAMGCALRLYRLRLAVEHQLALRNNSSGSSTLGRLPIQGRLPPPTYAMAMGLPDTPPERLQRQRRRHRRSRRSRPPPPPPPPPPLPERNLTTPVVASEGRRVRLTTPSSQLWRFVRDFWSKPHVQEEERMEDISCEAVVRSDQRSEREVEEPESATTEVELHIEMEDGDEHLNSDDRRVLIEEDL